jgi:putative flippase GtrA
VEAGCDRLREVVLLRFLGFVFAGGVATALNYSLFSLLMVLGVHYLVASAVGYASGIIVSFLINRRYVFRSTGDSRRQLARYTLIYLGAMLVQLGLLEVFVRIGSDPFIANACAIIIVVILNFFVIRRFVFK